MLDIDSKKAIIFDVDGTLYSQPKMRFAMGLKLLCYYVLHFWKMKELLSVYYFRKLREQEHFRECTIEEQIEAASKKAKTTNETAQATINKWMFIVPLELVVKYSYKELLRHINQWYDEGKKIIIYSDYPANEKIKWLNIPATHVFTPQNDNIGELKPSKRAMSYILEQVGISSKHILYVGDRDEKDGESAHLAEVDYCDIKAFLRIIENKSEIL